VNTPLPGPPLRIAVLGDFDGPHTRAWLQVFTSRGHDVHAISYYTPQAPLAGVTLHVLSNSTTIPPSDPTALPANPDSPQSPNTPLSPPPDPLSPGGERIRERGRRPSLTTTLRGALPTALQRYVHAWRYRRAGLRRLLDELHPDVFHAHYAVEHGFYGAVGYHPYVVSAWGSDLLVESYKGLNRRIARRALLAADLVTGNDASLVKRAVELGVPPEKTAVVHLGIERVFLEAGERSVNLSDTPSPPAILSFRALERLYNVDSLVLAILAVKKQLPEARLLIAGDGRERSRLEALVKAYDHSGAIEFLGRVDHETLPGLLTGSQVYVSVPSSDSLALSNLEAMAAGAFPIVSDLPSVDGWIEDGVNGFRVPPRDVEALTDAVVRAFNDPGLRRRAALHNRALVAARGLRETNMLLMERHYYRLAGHPVTEQGDL
jgi:glycosyltransferase involved in cell wall biosynthesis